MIIRDVPVNNLHLPREKKKLFSKLGLLYAVMLVENFAELREKR